MSNGESATRRSRALAAFVVGVMLIFSVGLQVQQRNSAANTARIARLVTALCLSTQTSAKSLNKQIDQTIVSVRVSTALTAAEKADRIRRYQKVKAIVPDCGGKNR